ncbi:MAG: ABC transporter substrate-binding protein [Thermoplasmata archaeon]
MEQAPEGVELGPGKGGRSKIAIVFVVTFLVSFAALESIVLMILSDDDAESSQEERILRIGFLDGVDSLNPFRGVNEASYTFYGLVYDCLHALDQDLRPTPNLALEQWVVPESDPAMVESGEPYGSVWQYNLTRNAYWHDGKQFTADDVVFTFNLCSQQNYSYFWDFQPYSFYIGETERIDNFTVRVHFRDRWTREPIPVVWGDFLPIPIMPEHRLSTYRLMDLVFNWTGVYPEDVSPGMPIVGTGPFMATPDIYDEWRASDRITLVRNNRSHAAADFGLEIHFDKLVLQPYKRATDMMSALGNGSLDVARFYPDSVFAAIEESIMSNATAYTALTAHHSLATSGAFVRFSFLADSSGPNPIRADPVVRMAMAMAVNRTTVNQLLYSGLASEGSTVVSPLFSDWHYEPSESERIKYDIVAANQLLNDSWYIDTDGDGIREATEFSKAVLQNWVPPGTPLNFTLVVPRMPDYYIGAISQGFKDYIVSEFAKIGVEVQIQTADPYRLCPWEEDVGLWVASWYGIPPDPHAVLFAATSMAINGWSDTRYSNKSYDEMFNASVSALNREERKSFVDACQRQFYLDCPYIVLAYPHACYVWSNQSFVGWGDWAAHPGRQISGTAYVPSPLLFDLEYVSYPPPSEEESLFPIAGTVIAAVASLAIAGGAAWAYTRLAGRR